MILKTFELLYSKQYQAWNTRYGDDRQLYCNLYLMVTDALAQKEQFEELSPYIRNAINKRVKTDRKTMDNIISRFPL